MTDTSPPDPPPASPWSPFEAAFRANLSLDRLRRYHGGPGQPAWREVIGRYLYNMELARTLYPVLHWTEIALRNRLNRVIGARFPLDATRGYRHVRSWLDADPPVLLPSERARVDQALRTLTRGNLAAHRPLTEGRLVSELSFGFWTHLLDGAYENWRITQRFWPALLEPAFPYCAASERNRKQVHARYQEIKEVRNRAFHHRRIDHQVDVALYDRFVEGVAWIDPMVARPLMERERGAFLSLLRDGPAPFVEWVDARAAA
jgi:hypothetical protein